MIPTHSSLEKHKERWETSTKVPSNPNYPTVLQLGARSERGMKRNFTTLPSTPIESHRIIYTKQRIPKGLPTNP